MNGEVEDANTVGADSSTAQGATETHPLQDDKADSSTAGAKEPSSLSEALEKVELEQPAEEAAGATTSQEQQSAESPSTEAEPGETESDAVAGPKDGQPAKEGQGTTGADAPFHTRPEWQKAEAYFKKNPAVADVLKPILRAAFQSETRVQEQLRAIQPKAEVADELQRMVGGEREFAAMRNLVRGFAAGDPATLPVLRQMVQQMEKATGEVIQSADLIQKQAKLQQRYDEGLIDQTEFQEQSALLQEVERTRAGTKRVETQQRAAQQTQTQQQQAEAMQQRTTALNSWEEKIRSDPQRNLEFGDVTDVNDPKHGESVADQVFDAMSLKLMQKPNASTEELLQAADKAYARARNGKPIQPLRQQRVATSQSSSVTGKQRPRNMREAMDAVKLE